MFDPVWFLGMLFLSAYIGWWIWSVISSTVGLMVIVTVLGLIALWLKERT